MFYCVKIILRYVYLICENWMYMSVFDFVWVIGRKIMKGYWVVFGVFDIKLGNIFCGGYWNRNFFFLEGNVFEFLWVFFFW